MDNQETFRYTYSAKEQTELEKIRKKYLPPEENKLEQLRKLDRSASRKAEAGAIALGVVGTLLLGAGMSLFMSELGVLLGFSQILALVVGVIAGLAGLVMVAMAYPMYNRILRKERQRIAPEVLRLTDELMK